MTHTRLLARRGQRGEGRGERTEVRRAFALTLTPTLTLALLLPTSTKAQTPDPRDYRVVVRVPREEANTWLADQIGRSGGAWEKGRYHFVIGFSTGHFGSDPVHAIATRRLAFGLLNNSFAVGDRVTPVAWEMKVWDRGKAIPLTADPASRAAFVDSVPYAPSEGSRGGHDTEMALYETLTGVVPKGQEKSTVVLLLTNSNQSQGPTGARAQLFGANNQLLQQAIRQRGYRSPVRHTFTAATESKTLNIDVTALFPEKIVPLPGSPSTPRFPTFPLETWQPAADRPASASDLPNPVERGAGSGERRGPDSERSTLPPPRSTPSFPWPILVGVLVVAALAAFALLSRKGKRRAPEKEEKPVAVPKGRPLPGSVIATLGAAPKEKKVTLKSLATANRWTLARDADGSLALTDAEPPEGTPLAALSFDPKNRLQLTALGDTLFHELKGTNVADSNSKSLIVALGDRIICRVASGASAAAPTRLELQYTKES